MLEISSTTTRHAGFGEPRIVELGRGTAHPHAGMTTRERVARSLLLAQLSAHPWELVGDEVEEELASFASTRQFNALVNDLARTGQRGSRDGARGPGASVPGCTRDGAGYGLG